MKIHRFWLDTIPQETRSILTQRELIHLFNTQEEKQVEIVEVSKHQLSIKLTGKIRPTHAPVKIQLAVSLLKGDSWDDIIRGCVALGITDIQPLLCDRSIVRELNSTKLQRYQTIAKETVEQSGWNHKTTFLPVQQFSSWIESVDPQRTF